MPQLNSEELRRKRGESERKWSKMVENGEKWSKVGLLA
jgi:hypothetical protein